MWVCFQSLVSCPKQLDGVQKTEVWSVVLNPSAEGGKCGALFPVIHHESHVNSAKFKAFLVYVRPSSFKSRLRFVPDYLDLNFRNCLQNH